MVTFGNYCESQLNSITTNLSRDYIEVEIFYLIALNLHKLECWKNVWKN